jgi:hypothetical protein
MFILCSINKLVRNTFDNLLTVQKDREHILLIWESAQENVRIKLWQIFVRVIVCLLERLNLFEIERGVRSVDSSLTSK